MDPTPTRSPAAPSPQTGGAASGSRLLRAYRRTGADVPFGDPRPSHRAEMEGYFWRVTDRDAGRVVVVLCGVNRHPGGDWATVAVALHPEGIVREALVDHAWADEGRLHVVAGSTFVADERSVRVRIDDVDVQLAVDTFDPWPRRVLPGGGIASVVPGLNQYWHPWALGGRVDATVRLPDGVVQLRGAQLYAEKNWGSGFPPEWWWGQAQGFDRDDVCVAFSGGHLAAGRLHVHITGVVVRVGDRVVRLAPPAAAARAQVGAGRWRVQARDLRTVVRIDADGAGSVAHPLPVPVPAERRQHATDFEHLAGRLDVVVRRDGRTLYSGVTELAALETGTAPT